MAFCFLFSGNVMYFIWGTLQYTLCFVEQWGLFPNVNCINISDFISNQIYYHLYQLSYFTTLAHFILKIGGLSYIKELTMILSLYHLLQKKKTVSTKLIS